MTHGSVLQSAIHPEHIQKFVDQSNYSTLPILDWNLSQVYPYIKSTEKPIVGLLKNFQVDEIEVTCALYALNRKGFGELLRISNGLPVQDNSKNIGVVLPEGFGIPELEDIDLRIKTFNPINPARVLTASEANRYKVIIKKAKAEYDAPVALEKDMTDWSCLAPLYEAVESYSLENEPRLPHFPTGGKSEDALLSEICEKSFKDKNLDNSIYRDRLTYELNTFKSAGMSGYFLIMWDICKFIRDSGSILSIGRGSAAGCLVSYLLGITKADPIQYDLIFERFYNPERKGVPDIDCDIVPEFRPKVIDYLREKYGEDKVAQLCTYTTFKGRGALKETLKQQGMAHAEANKVTECLHDETKIDPQLKDQQNELGTKSVVLYTLLHSRRLDFWCKFNKRTKQYTGKWADAFKLAVEMDRTNVAIGKHASAFVLSDGSLINQCPIIPDPANGPHPICGWEMNAAEKSGLVKLDLLGLDCLSKYLQSRESISSKSIYLESI